MKNFGCFGSFFFYHNLFFAKKTNRSHHSDGREDLLGRRDGLVDVLLGVGQGGEARLVLRRGQVDALQHSENFKKTIEKKKKKDVQ